MYKNRSTNIPTIDRHPQFFIRRSEIQLDQRARYVEFVCDVWNEGRFGPDLAAPVTLDWAGRPDLEPTAFCDLPDDDPNALMPFEALRLLGRAGQQSAEAAYQRAKRMGIVDAGPAVRNSASALAPNQGRGSP